MWKKAFSLVALVTAGTGLALGQDVLSPNPPMARYPGQQQSVPAVSGAVGIVPGQTNPYRAYHIDSPAGVVATPPAGAATNGGCDSCGCAGECRLHGWLSVDYMMVFPNDINMPTVLQDANGNRLAGGPIGFGISHAIRFNSGLWLCDERLGMQTVGLGQFRDYVTSTTPAGVIPVGIAGAAGLAATNFNFQAWTQMYLGEGNTLLRLGHGDSGMRLYGLGGAVFGTLEEDILMNYTLGAGNFTDEFHTRNQFFGGQIGAIFSTCQGPFTIDVTAKLALGNNYTQLWILGSNSAGQSFQAFTGRSNIGYYETNYFSMIPQAAVNLGYAITQRLSANIGYNFMMWTNTWRPGNQISTFNDGGVTQPSVPFNLSTYFLHGANFGFTFRF